MPRRSSRTCSPIPPLHRGSSPDAVADEIRLVSAHWWTAVLSEAVHDCPRDVGRLRPEEVTSEPRAVVIPLTLWAAVQQHVRDPALFDRRRVEPLALLALLALQQQFE